MPCVVARVEAVSRLHVSLLATLQQMSEQMWFLPYAICQFALPSAEIRYVRESAHVWVPARASTC